MSYFKDQLDTMYVITVINLTWQSLYDGLGD